MKKNSFKVLFGVLMFILIAIPISTATDVQFSGITGMVDDTYVVKCGDKITLNGSAQMSSSDTTKAVISGNQLSVIGSGNFTVKLNGNELKFFSWNAYLINGQYWGYKDLNRKTKDGVLKSKIYLDVSKTQNEKSLLIKSYLFARGGTYAGKYAGELEGKYITSYYDEATRSSTSSNFKYSFNDSTQGDIIKTLTQNDVKLNKSSVEVYVNETTTLKALVKNTLTEIKENIVWTSNDPRIATVKEGVVTGVKVGTTTVSCCIDDRIVLNCTVYVKDRYSNGNTNSNNNGNANSDKLEIHFIDPNSRVDAIYIKVGDKSIFIDGGFHWDADVEIKYLKRLGVTKIDYYIGSHAHSNHVGAAGPILKAFDIDVIYYGPQKYGSTSSVIWMMKDKAKEYGYANKEAELAAIARCEQRVINVGDTININGLKIICLGPVKLTSVRPSGGKENLNSLILRLEYGNHSFLFAGDTGAEQLKQANNKFPGMLDVDIYKNSHHNQVMSESVIKLISPRYMVFTTSDSGKPSSSYTKMISKYCSKYFLVTTKKDRNVLIESDGVNMNITTKYNVVGVTPVKVLEEIP